ncbi:MAG TPA: hypothetical protein DDW27_03915 [Bacteroidales bacterium]|nr:hypothetical protein [Bacteroidales bacterium]
MIFVVLKYDKFNYKQPAMKPIILLLLFLLTYPLSLAGQPGKNKSVQIVTKDSDIFTREVLRNLRKENNSNNINPVFISDTLLNHRPENLSDKYNGREPRKRFSPDFRIAEELEIYPGAPKFYGKKPYIPSPFEKSFIIKTVPPGKYYLIIKDPITHRIIN